MTLSSLLLICSQLKRQLQIGLQAFIPWFGVTLILGCLASTATIKESLDEAAKEDLKIILQDLPPNAQAVKLSRPYFVIDEFQEFHGDTALVYQARAKLVFFYLDPALDLCQIRKYRFKRSNRSWERYENELKHTPQKFVDSTQESGPQ